MRAHDDMGRRWKELRLKTLIERFDAAVTMGGTEFRPPTADSVARIESHLRLRLPPELVQMARESRHFHHWFAGLGPDFVSPTHIVGVNGRWRREAPPRRPPANFVAFTLGFDGDLDGFVLDPSAAGSPPRAIRHWSPGVDDGPRHASFREYLEACLEFWEKG